MNLNRTKSPIEHRPMDNYNFIHSLLIMRAYVTLKHKLAAIILMYPLYENITFPIIIIIISGHLLGSTTLLVIQELRDMVQAISVGLQVSDNVVGVKNYRFCRRGVVPLERPIL